MIILLSVKSLKKLQKGGIREKSRRIIVYGVVFLITYLTLMEIVK